MGHIERTGQTFHEICARHYLATSPLKRHEYYSGKKDGYTYVWDNGQRDVVFVYGFACQSRLFSGPVLLLPDLNEFLQ